MTETLVEEAPEVAQLLDRFADSAEDLLVRMRDKVTEPLRVKTMRSWGIEDAARLIGRTPQMIRLAEKEGEALERRLGPTPRDTRGRRSYTLARINAYRDHFRTRYRRAEGSRPMRLVVSNFKGGAGKTTTSVHLAQRAAIDGLRVLLIDLDAQATTTQQFGLVPAIDVDPQQTIHETLVSNPALIRSVVRPTYIDGLDLVPANLKLQDTELILPNPARNNAATLGLASAWRLDAALATIEDDYDLIVIDTGPNMGAVTVNALCAATGLLVTIPPATNDFGSSSLFFRSLAELYSADFFTKGSFTVKLEFVRILVTRHTGSKEANQAEAMIRFAYGARVLEPVMLSTVELERSTNDFSTVYEASPGGGAREEFKRGSHEAYRRAFESMERVNAALLEEIKAHWRAQADER